jgi:hypothetical protein
VATDVRPATKLKGAALALAGGSDHQLLHYLLLDLASSLTIFFALQAHLMEPHPCSSYNSGHGE